LRAAFYNTERAVEYLCNGIPAGLNRPPQSAQPVAGSGAGLGLGGETGIAQLRALFNHPNFAQIRDLIRTNPAALQPILAQISQTSPQLYNVPSYLLS
jgi:UV excision repair protein RAD23